MMERVQHQAILIADLGFGDSGKGSITDYLSRKFQAHTVIRYNGGPQAGHSVIAENGQHHKFSQFTSATFLPGTKTYLSRFMYIDPLSMLKEEGHLQSLRVTDAFDRTSIDREVVVITPFHQAVNRLRELARGKNRQGTCGLGISEICLDYTNFKDDVLKIKDLENADLAYKKLNFLRDVQLEKMKGIRNNLSSSDEVSKELSLLEPSNLSDYLSACVEMYSYFSSKVNIVDTDFLSRVLKLPGTIIFEGAQGVLLDQRYGFYPFITGSNTTFENADILLSEQDYTGVDLKIGVVRVYATRHGVGPFVSEDPNLNFLFDPHNLENFWQGKFRIGYFDLLSAKYAIDCLGKVDRLAITHLDQLSVLPKWKICTAYDTEDGSLEELKVHRPPQLSYQEGLTKFLEKCIPIYQILDEQKGETAYLSFLQENLGVPIGILSYGPSSAHKKWINL